MHTDKVQMQVWARDPTRVRRGILDVIDARAVLRESNVGTWTMTVEGDDDITDLFQPGWGVIVHDGDKQMLSGPATGLRFRPEGSGMRVEINGVTDAHVLADRLVYPNPAQTAETQTAAYWSRIGSGYYVNDLLSAMTNRNVGVEALADRKVPGFRASAYGSANGKTSSTHTRFARLLDELRPVARAGGYVLDVVQDGTDLVFVKREAVDRHRGVRFMPESGLLDYELSITAPTATTVLVAGQGEGAARTIREHSSTDTSWGRRIEVFQDRRDTNAAQELEKAAVETLQESAGSSSASFTIEETEDLKFGRDYDLGDTVTVAVRGTEIINGIRTADITWDEFGRTVKLTVGDYSAPEDTDPAWGKRVREAIKAIRHLEGTQ